MFPFGCGCIQLIEQVKVKLKTYCENAGGNDIEPISVHHGRGIRCTDCCYSSWLFVEFFMLRWSAQSRLRVFYLFFIYKCRTLVHFCTATVILLRRPICASNSSTSLLSAIILNIPEFKPVSKHASTAKMSALNLQELASLNVTGKFQQVSASHSSLILRN